MIDWIGSVAIRARTAQRLELDLTRATAISGLALCALGAWLVAGGMLWMIILGVMVLAGGGLLATLRRRLVFDREDGVLRIDQSVFGVRKRAAIPLFHLRAVVVAPRRRRLYVAYVERRVGPAIYLDEATAPTPLLELANAIADVADVRVVRLYDNDANA
jgi:hypothetical protein